ERVFLRALGLFLSEIFTFGRHTVTQGLLALGLTDADWSPWYRLFSHGRFVAEKAASILVAETLRHVPEDQPYVAGVDGVGVPRTGRKMPGTAWLPALFTAPFRRGLQRIQRFLDLAWLTPLEEGYSRAIPLLWFPAFTEKAVKAQEFIQKEWEAALHAVRWLRGQLDTLGRAKQWILLLVDGSLEKVTEFWKGLPERVVVLGRTARNRA
ncbi:MAG: transposase, partial [Anaerolineae bacterium]